MKVSDASEERAYLTQLTNELALEIEALGADTRDQAEMLAACAELTAHQSELTVGEAYAAYERICARKGAARALNAQFADSYSSMEHFWQEADLQEQGRGTGTYWDTYENGARRQLETVAATAFRAEASLFVNSGMSALDIAVGGIGLRPGDRLMVHEQAYFETVDYLSRVAEGRGISVVKVDLTNAAATETALDAAEPRAVLLETAVNCPPCDVPLIEPLLDREHVLIVDNSLLSHAIRWFELFPRDRLIVFESGIKYLTRGCGLGVLYSTLATIERLRAYARATGQLLQEKAFAFVQRGELRSAARRVAIHSRNVERFLEHLDRSTWGDVWSATESCAGRQDLLASAVDQAGPGSLAYARLRGSDEAVTHRHREIVARWKQMAEVERIDLRIRAGFGWSHPSARAYESSRLNQAYAPLYLRISLGLGPVSEASALAGMLNDLGEGTT